MFVEFAFQGKFDRTTHPKFFTQQELFGLVCYTCAVLFETLCAKLSFFDTLNECFRAGLGKLLIRKVGTRNFPLFPGSDSEPVRDGKHNQCLTMALGAGRLEPAVPFEVSQASGFEFSGFTHMVIAESPQYGPQSARQLIGACKVVPLRSDLQAVTIQKSDLLARHCAGFSIYHCWT